MDIWQNLRGPETSAAGPYREADGSRPICRATTALGRPE